MACKTLWVSVGLTLLVVLSSLPAGAATPVQRREARTGEQLLEHLPADAVVADANGVTGKLSATQALQQVVDHRDRQAWLGSIAAVIEQRSGTPVATGGTSSEPAPDESGETGGEPEPSAWAEGAPAGDLDGDGLADVVVFSYDPAHDTLALEARKGSTGEVLWRQPGDADGGLAWPLDHDADGDGATELLTYNLLIDDQSYSDNCGEDEEGPCDEGRYEVTYRWIIGARSGATGEQLWSRTYAGSLEESWSDKYTGGVLLNEYSGTMRFGGTNVDVFPMLADLEGDGSADILLQTVDAMYTETYEDSWVGTPVADAGQYSGASNLRAETRVDIANLADGVVNTTLTESAEGLVAFVSPVAARGGDDLVWERSLSPDSDYDCVYVWSFEGVAHCDGTRPEDTLEAVLIDGRTFEPRWTQVFDAWGMVWTLGGDLDDDGREDLAVLSETDGWDFASNYLSSSTGKVLWSVDNGEPFAVADYDGQAGDDVMVLTFTSNEDDPLAQQYSETLTLERRSGTSGAVVSTSQRSTSMDGDGDYNYRMIYVAGTGDLDGDGTPDVTHGELSLSEECVEEEDYEYCDVTATSSDAVAESGRSGAQLLHESSDSKLSLLTGTGDLDGDGLAELVRETEDWSGDGAGYTVEMVRVADGSTLWADAPGDAWVYYDVAGNMDGGAGDDLLRNVMGGFVVIVEGEEGGGSAESSTGGHSEFYAGVSAVDGATGTVSWQVPAR